MGRRRGQRGPWLGLFRRALLAGAGWAGGGLSGVSSAGWWRGCLPNLATFFGSRLPTRGAIESSLSSLGSVRHGEKLRWEKVKGLLSTYSRTDGG